MAIISQETWDKFTEEEKEDIRHLYNGLETMQDRNTEGVMNSLFGKENLQPKPEIKTWKDVKEEYMLRADTGTSYIIDMDKNFYSEKLALKALATLQIAKLIELGYGGMVTEEEWKDNNIEKYCVYSTAGKIHYDGFNTYDCRFVAFHTSEQRKEFMSYPENVKLVEQYYMI